MSDDYDGLVADFNAQSSDNKPADAPPEAPSPAAAPASPYDDLVSQFNAGRHAQAQAINVGAQLGDADKAGRAEEVGKQLGLPGPAVAADLPTYEQRLAITKSSQILAQSPALQDWLINNPDKAVQAKDDFAQLSGLEHLIKGAQAGWSESFNPPKPGQEFQPIGRAATAGHMAGSVVGFMAEAYTSPEAVAGYAGGATLGVLGGPAAPATIPALAGMGATLGAASHVVRQTFQQSLDSSADIRDSNGHPLSDAARIGLASVNSVIQGMMVGVGGGIATDAMKSAEMALSDAMQKPSIVAALSNYGAGMLKSAAHAGVIGGGLDAVQQTSEQLARALSNSTDQTQFQTWLSNPETIPAAIEHVVGEGAKWAAFGGALHGTLAIPGLASDLTAARRAQSDSQFIAALADGSSQSKLRERDPDSFHSFLAQQTDGSPVENLYVPADAVRELYQSYGVQPGPQDGLLGGIIPDLPKQLEIGLAGGGDVRIPTADYGTRLAGTEIDKQLRPDLRVGMDGMTMREAKDANDRMQEIFQQRYEEMQRQHIPAGEAQTPEQAVYKDWNSHLRSQGIAAIEAAAHAQVMAAHYGADAQRFTDAGDDRHDAWTLYQQAQARVVRHLPESLRRYDVDALIASKAGEGKNGPDLFSRPANSLDALIDDVRNGRKDAAQSAGPTLAQYVSRRGGVTDLGGELQAMGADGAFHPDDVAQAAGEAGYFPDLQGERPSPNHLFEALREELAGRPRHADPKLTDKLDSEDHANARADLERTLDEAGIDLKSGLGKNNRYVKEALAKWSAKSEEGQGKELFQRSSSVLDALRAIAGGADEATMPSLRPDLEKFGGTSDVSLVWGDVKAFCA